MIYEPDPEPNPHEFSSVHLLFDKGIYLISSSEIMNNTQESRNFVETLIHDLHETTIILNFSSRSSFI